MRELWRIELGVLALLCAACPRPPITQHQRDAFGAALDGWHAAGNADPGSCLAGARVELAESYGRIVERCYLYGGYSEMRVAGCLSRYARGMFGSRDGWLVMVAPGYEHDDSLVVHEALHALVRCTGMGPAGDPFDSAHSLPSVWSAAGKEKSAQSLSGVRHP